MVVPDYQTLKLPILKFLGDGQEHTLRETVEATAAAQGLSEEDLKELLPSGKQRTIDNRVGWAITYMSKAKLIERPRKGIHRITQRGRDVLAKKPDRIDNKYLLRFPEFAKFKARPKKGSKAGIPQPEQESHPALTTPEENIQEAYDQLRGALADELMELILKSSPDFFERLVVRLLVQMGYGGSLRDAGEAVGKSGDGGIDGIIKEDILGLDVIYIQAKRWENTVGRPEIQKFVGALLGKQAKKGVFITTSGFSKEAIEYARVTDLNVVLIDGEELTDFMIDFDLGVSKAETYEIKHVDGDYFTDE